MLPGLNMTVPQLFLLSTAQVSWEGEGERGGEAGRKKRKGVSKD